MSGAVVAFAVSGHPTPKGSGEGTKKQRANKRRLSWLSRLELAFSRYRRRVLWDGPVRVDCVFWLPAPKGVDPRSPQIEPPDIDKLLRTVLDEAKDAIYVDDARVVEGHIYARWAIPGVFDPGAALSFTELTLQEALSIPDWAMHVSNAIPEVKEE